MTKADSLRARIALADKEISNLVARYGDSTRPAWVGEEIGIITMHKMNAENELKKLEQDSAN
jgi:hypothetical protein